MPKTTSNSINVKPGLLFGQARLLDPRSLLSSFTNITPTHLIIHFDRFSIINYNFKPPI